MKFDGITLEKNRRELPGVGRGNARRPKRCLLDGIEPAEEHVVRGGGGGAGRGVCGGGGRLRFEVCRAGEQRVTLAPQPLHLDAVAARRLREDARERLLGGIVLLVELPAQHLGIVAQPASLALDDIEQRPQFVLERARP